VAGHRPERGELSWAYKLDDVERYQLMQVVHGYTGRCNEAAGSGCAPNTERILSWCRKTATSASNAVRIVTRCDDGIKFEPTSCN
jgi:hypothetical protein